MFAFLCRKLSKSLTLYLIRKLLFVNNSFPNIILFLFGLKLALNLIVFYRILQMLNIVFSYTISFLKPYELIIIFLLNILINYTFSFICIINVGGLRVLRQRSSVLNLFLNLYSNLRSINVYLVNYVQLIFNFILI